MLCTIYGIAALAALASAYEIPPHLKAIYETHKNGSCSNPLSEPMTNNTVYCGDVNSAIFLKGNNSLADMSIDCDGANNSAGDCANDPTGQAVTAFSATASTFGIPDLDANLHPYVVFGNAEGSPAFDPKEHDLQPLSVMAVVCNDQLLFGVWGDVNGGNVTGEASISLAKMCFPDEGLTGAKGHNAMDVLYIGFMGDKAVPGKCGANWQAGSTQEFMDSIKPLGDELVAGLLA